MNKSTKIILIGSLIALALRLTNLTAFAYLALAGAFWFALHKNWLRSVLRFIAIVLVLMALISNELSASAHLVFGCALISFQMVLSLWFAVKSLNWIDGVIVVIEQVAGIGILFGLANKNPYLLPFQILFQACFVILLVRVVNAPTDKKVLSI
mgnify:CR=1 FL=1